MENRSEPIAWCEHCGAPDGTHNAGCPASKPASGVRVPWAPGEVRPLRVGDGFTIAGHDYVVTEVLPRGRFRLKLVARP